MRNEKKKPYSFVVDMVRTFLKTARANSGSWMDLVIDCLAAPAEHPATWPKPVRIAYLLLFPIMWPLRMAYMIAAVILASAIMICCSLVLAIGNIWCGRIERW